MSFDPTGNLEHFSMVSGDEMVSNGILGKSFVLNGFILIRCEVVGCCR